jgi:crossover junction endodeoxyribonuclease RusA
MIRLPWPPKELSPNARVHYRARAEVVKAYRTQAYWIADANLLAMPYEGEIVLSVEFLPPDKRRRDLDNMLASAKAALDGLADAHAVNDHRFALFLRRGEPTKGGAILVTVQS